MVNSDQLPSVLTSPPGEPAGLGGWLTFLILCLVLIWPVMGLGSMSTELNGAETAYPNLAASPEWSRYKAAAWWMFWTFTALSVAAGVVLGNARGSWAKWFAITVMLFGTAASYATNTALMWTVLGVAPSIGPEYVGKLVGGMVWPVVWSIYLLRSRRVRNTYR